MPEDNVIHTPAFSDTPPPPRDAEHLTQALSVITQWRYILNARLLALLALLGALGIFGYAVADPVPLRLWASSLYALGVLWPVMVLFLRKG